jgi:hypothetical protein
VGGDEMKATDLKYEKRQLIAIPSTLDWGDQDHPRNFDQILEEDFGFTGCSSEIGSGSPLAYKIHGPAGDGYPYRYLVDWDINDHWELVWCPTFADLQEYLVSIAPLLTMVKVDSISEIMDSAHSWLFDAYNGKGLFADHVRDFLHRDRHARRQRKNDQSSSNPPTPE